MFARDDGSTWDYVFNCGGDSRFSQDDEVYKQRSVQLSITAAREAARRGVRCWVELSSGAVYKPERDPPRKETDRLKPWTRLAKYKLEAEDELQKIQGYVAPAQVRLAVAFSFRSLPAALSFSLSFPGRAAGAICTAERAAADG